MQHRVRVVGRWGRYIGVAAVVALVACGGRPAVRGPGPAVVVDPPVAAPAEPAPLTPPQPPLRLPTNFVPTGYQARLAIDPAAPTFDGEIAIAGTITARSAVVWLHGRGLDVTDAVARQGAVEIPLAVAPRGDDLLELTAAAPLPVGAWTLALRYRGVVAAVETVGAFVENIDGARYVFSHFEPLDARRVFPCVDEPAAKVPWQLTLDVPAGVEALSNSPIASTTRLPDGRARVAFAPTPPLPSYLIAFAVGPLDFVDGGRSRSGVPIRIVVPRGRGGETAVAAQVTAPVLAMLEDWFGTPYPFAKLDVVAIPRLMTYTAMEHPGLITFGGWAILADGPITERWRRTLISVMGHELAHQWFGNLVTMAWWDDLWLNEGFATWMARKVLAALAPTATDDLDAESDRQDAMVDDRLLTARQIRQPIDSAADIVTAFDGITYGKAAAVLDMFEAQLGPARFQAAVRAYLAGHAGGTATAVDFAGALDAVADAPVAPALTSFLERGGVPLLRFTLACAGDQVDLEITQTRWVPAGVTAPDAPPWRVPVCVAFERAGARVEHCATLADARATWRLATTQCPRWLVPNVGGAGYYRARVDGADPLANDRWAAMSARERVAAVWDLRVEVEAGRADVGTVLARAPELLAHGTRHTRRAVLLLTLNAQAALDGAARRRFDAWAAQAFAPIRGDVGWTPDATDDLERDWVRRRVLPLLAEAGDRRARAAAVQVARSWRRLPPGLREPVVMVAADADATTFHALRAELATTTEPDERATLLVALGAATDPDRQREALALTLDPALPPDDALTLLFAANGPAQRELMRGFFRDHQAELLARFPASFATSTGLVGSLVGCDAATRDRDAAYLRSTFGAYANVESVIDQAIERMDQCIARRAVLEPGLRRWLATLPKQGAR
jgi:alanyl aminopeptidase